MASRPGSRADASSSRIRWRVAGRERNAPCWNPWDHLRPLLSSQPLPAKWPAGQADRNGAVLGMPAPAGMTGALIAARLLRLRAAPPEEHLAGPAGVSPPLASVLLSAERATHSTQPRCPSSAPNSWPATLHSRTVLSQLPLARVRPSGANARPEEDEACSRRRRGVPGVC